MRALARYSEANAVIRATLSSLLTKDQLEGILRAGTFADSWNALHSTVYGEWLPDMEVPAPLAVERALKDATARRFKRAIRSLHGRATKPGALLLARWELDDLHDALRVWHAKDANCATFAPSAELGHAVPFDDIAHADTLETIGGLLSRTPYALPILETARVYRETHSLFHLEIALEKGHYRRLVAAIQALGGQDAEKGIRLIATEIDLVNLSWLSRCATYYGDTPAALLREAMIPNVSVLASKLEKTGLSPEDISEMSLAYLSELSGGNEGRPPGLERIALLESLVVEEGVEAARRDLAGFPFTIACVIALYFLIRTELRNLRGIFAGRAAGFTQEELSSRLSGSR
ncbi:MAG: V-type ATPase subunit [Candidatus Hydrogenedentales bacterium]|jgi:vacuolar-type H+-ATPase subunit C/Vma6